jgi:hypothetical protein
VRDNIILADTIWIRDPIRGVFTQSARSLHHPTARLTGRQSEWE